jgi:hypothetical protein
MKCGILCKPDGLQLSICGFYLREMVQTLASTHHSVIFRPGKEYERQYGEQKSIEEAYISGYYKRKHTFKVL